MFEKQFWPELHLSLLIFLFKKIHISFVPKNDFNRNSWGMCFLDGAQNVCLWHYPWPRESSELMHYSILLIPQMLVSSPQAGGYDPPTVRMPWWLGTLGSSTHFTQELMIFSPLFSNFGLSPRLIFIFLCCRALYNFVCSGYLLPVETSRTFLEKIPPCRILYLQPNPGGKVAAATFLEPLYWNAVEWRKK